MTTNLYEIFLDDKLIGTTALEKADAPMGVVFGNIKLHDIPSGYQFFKTYCLTNGVKIISDYTDDKLFTTSVIATLKIINSNGIEIKGKGTSIEGMDSDVFEVIILGIAYPFYEEEFPHHVKAYEDQFK